MSNLQPGNTSPVSLSTATLLPSVLRTVVPLIYAMLVRYGVTSWLDPDDVFVTNLITVVVTGLFYIAVRLVEQHWSKIGWILGYGKPPVYVQGEVVTVTETNTPPTVTTEVESSGGTPAD